MFIPFFRFLSAGFLSLPSMKKTGIIFFLILVAGSLRAQVSDTPTRGTDPVPTDTTGKLKVEVWKINPDDEVIPARWDTLLTGFHRYDPAWRKYTFPLKPGNIVSPVLSASFTERIPFSDNPLLGPYRAYLPDLYDQYFFRVRQPFTQLTYASGGQKINLEQLMDVVHTQNVNEKLNVGLMLNFLSGEGQYSYEKAGKKTFGFFSSYTGDRYNLFISFSANRISRQENGGITDEDLIGVAKPKDLPTFLAQSNNAQTEIKNRHIDIIQTYAFGTFSKRDTTGTNKKGDLTDHAWGSLYYKMHYGSTGKSYADLSPTSGFYRNIYLDSLKTYDTAYFRNWDHEIGLHLQSNPDKKFSLESRIGLRYEMQKFVQNSFPDSVITATDTSVNFFSEKPIQNTALFGEVINDIGRGFYWKASGAFYFQGYKAGNTRVRGVMEKRFGRGGNAATLRIYGSLDIARPAFWLNGYTSNHFVWNNDFRFEKKIKAGGRFAIPSASLAMSGNVILLDQFVYFDSLVMPVQAGQPFLVYSGSIEKTFNFWKIRSQNNLTLQYSSDNDALPLPNVLYRNSTYFNHVFHFRSTGGQLATELGFDLYYFTPFDGYGFMPATGFFYNQHDKQIGNYPFLDVFLNVKVKRTRIFVKIDHVNANLTGNQYFMIVHYPANPLFFKGGLSWTFYD